MKSKLIPNTGIYSDRRSRSEEGLLESTKVLHGDSLYRERQRLRELHGVSVADMAAMFGISVSVYRKHEKPTESGGTVPGREAMERFYRERAILARQ